MIGELFVDSFSVRNSRCELDWKIGSRFWGNGYAVEAAECVLSYLTHEARLSLHTGQVLHKKPGV